MKDRGIFFDLDGTLVDTLEDLTDAMNWALQQLGFPPHTPQACREMIGYGTREFARRALPAGREDLTERLQSLMLEYYHHHCLEKTYPYEGLQEVLLRLKQEGVRLAVISNKNHPQTVKIVEYYFGPNTFDFICGMSEGFCPKPAPDMALAALKALSLTPPQVLLVGDSDMDILTARAAGIEPIGVSWGFRPLERLKEAGAARILNQPQEILTLL